LPVRLTVAVLLAIAVSIWPAAVSAHDASAWGGLFRTRDGGASWFQASSGKVMGGALALAIDPRDPDRLFLGTDSGLLGSRNGGRDWDLVASDLLLGPVLAVGLDNDGRTLMAATASTLAASDDGINWRSRLMPLGAAPPRALMPDRHAGAFYLLGWNGLFSTDDAGASWSSVDTGLSAAATQLLLDPDGTLLALAGGQLWRSANHGQSWVAQASGLPLGRVETMAHDRSNPGALWAGASNQLFHSTDAGQSWAAVGRPLPEADTRLRGIAPDLDGDPNRLLVSTDRGLYATRDRATTWDLLADNLPGHIEAGPLAVDSRQPATLYAGFSVTPYDEVWQNAASGNSTLARLGSGELAGAGAFVLLLILCAVLALRTLARRSQRAPVARGLAG
jgi:photosystem II stability/assembly factor-like uncharacterized protein